MLKKKEKTKRELIDLLLEDVANDPINYSDFVQALCREALERYSKDDLIKLLPEEHIYD